MSSIDQTDWSFDYPAALEESRRSGKPVFMQFHRENCSGCRKLYTVTYPDQDVLEELFRWLIPLRVDILADRPIRSRYAAYWTPSFYFLDYKGKDYSSFNGYLNPEDFRVVLRLGKASLDIPKGKYRETINLMDDGLAKFPDNPRAASMLFTKGMAAYLIGRDKLSFYDVMTEIIEKYPDSPEARMWPWMNE